MSDWAWEYEPDEEHVIGGGHPPGPAFVARVEERADEIVRAAAALYLDGSSYQGSGEGVQTAFVDGGMFLHLVVPRHQRVYVLQVTAW
ncbi:hypothetical protein LO771_27835 [Streptacidiphilus sp. ASG 303]|uniref:hypothetical protein n=1 Tax=Streptacidiphilus sp. ASG 303 TaxID=2896847 RepID=UPI001E323427|nr:hypothetical protein [Streptacidiphilus sp. ASG 303]MCD0486089.1 hypothetical protein [Streptacidiphilus sp. ASG 303]